MHTRELMREQVIDKKIDSKHDRDQQGYKIERKKRVRVLA